MKKNKAFNNIKKGFKMSKAEDKANVNKAVADAYNATFKPNQMTKDVKTVSKGINPIAKEMIEKEINNG
tara:strand:+ start:616 stop:822 length:207 start_codon:yes stop_codon:yes gene_type:complete